MKKWFSPKAILAMMLMLVLALACSMALADEPTHGQLLRFIPTIITVEEESVTVEGYFVNLNDDCDVKNFTNFEMDVYKDDTLLVEGSFGDINKFTVKSMGVKYQSFTYNGEHDLNEGEYICNGRYYALFSCGFTSVT